MLEVVVSRLKGALLKIHKGRLKHDSFSGNSVPRDLTPKEGNASGLAVAADQRP